MEPEPRRRLLMQAEAAYREVVADPRGGRPAAESVATAARAAGDVEALVVALRAAGWAARELYDHAAAQRHLDEAVRVAGKAGLRDRLSEALVTRSAVHLEVGRDARARRDLTDARLAAGRPARAEVAFAEGLLEDEVGDYGAAVRAYRRALRLVDDDHPHLRVKTLNNLALTALRVGRYEEADQRLAEAAALAATFSPAASAIVAHSQAFLSIESGRPTEALRRYERAEQLMRAADLPLVELHQYKAAAFLALRLLDEAAAAADRAVREYEEHVGGSLMLAEALVLQARIALAQERFDQAIDASAHAEQLFRRQRRRGWRAVAVLLHLQASVRHGDLTAAMIGQLDRIERTMVRLGNAPSAVEAGLLLGQVATSLGRRRKAANAFERAAATARGGPVLLRLQGRMAAALKAELDGDTARLGQLCRSGLHELAGYRASFASAELRARAAAHGRSLADLGLRAALRSRRAERVWVWIEQAQATIFLRAGPSGSAADIEPLLAELRSLEIDLGALPPDEDSERTSLLRRITRLERRIRSRTWTLDGGSTTWTAPSVAALRMLRADLGGRALLQYGMLDERLVAVAVTQRSLRFAELGSVTDVTNASHQLAFALRRLGQPRSRLSTEAALVSARSELRRLAELLVVPLTDVVSGAEEVVVAVPSALVSIPWGVLAPLAGQPVRVVPSAISWWRTQDRRPRSDRVVLVAGPGLAGAREEVEAIAARYPEAQQFVDGRAACGAVRDAAAGAGLVHLACHGKLRADTAAFSALQLADGPLTVHDLERLPEPAHHWVLAACDLGSPGPLAGRELEGVLAALLFGGAAGVVAAVVSVPDVPTAELMVRLHDALLGGASLSQAVGLAREGLDTGDPAAFVTSVAFSCYGGG